MEKFAREATHLVNHGPVLDVRTCLLSDESSSLLVLLEDSANHDGILKGSFCLRTGEERGHAVYCYSDLYDLLLGLTKSHYAEVEDSAELIQTEMWTIYMLMRTSQYCRNGYFLVGIRDLLQEMREENSEGALFRPEKIEQHRSAAHFMQAWTVLHELITLYLRRRTQLLRLMPKTRDISYEEGSRIRDWLLEFEHGMTKAHYLQPYCGLHERMGSLLANSLGCFNDWLEASPRSIEHQRGFDRVMRNLSAIDDKLRAMYFYHEVRTQMLIIEHVRLSSRACRLDLLHVHITMHVLSRLLEIADWTLNNHFFREEFSRLYDQTSLPRGKISDDKLRRTVSDLRKIADVLEERL